METIQVLDSRDRWLAFCLAVFCDGKPTTEQAAYFTAACLNDPSRGTGKILVVMDDRGEIAAGLQIIDRCMYLFGTGTRFCGISNVATRADMRGRGYASRLMERAVREMETEGVALSMLGTALAGFYARFGYIHVSQKMFRVIRGTAEKRCDVLGIQPDDQRLRRLYLAAARSRNGAVARETDEYWERWMAPRTDSRWLAVPGESKKSMAAYLSYQGDEVLEYACLTSREEALDALLDAVPSDSPLVPCGFPTSRTLECAVDREGLMIRLNCPLRIRDAAITDTTTLAALLADERTAFAFSENDSF